MEKVFLLTVSTNGMSIQLSPKWNEVCFFDHRFGCDWLWLAEKTFNWNWRFSISWSRLVFFTKQHVPSPPNNIIVGLWSLEGIVETSWHVLPFCLQDIRDNVLHSLSRYGLRHTFVWKTTCPDTVFFIWHNELSFLYLRKNKTLGHTTTKMNLVVPQGSIAYLTRSREFKNVTFVFSARSKNLCVQPTSRRRLFVRTVHVLNKSTNPLFIPTIKVELVEQRSGSQFFHICLQRISSFL